MSSKDEKNPNQTTDPQSNYTQTATKQKTWTILISCPLWFEQHLKFQTSSYIYGFDFVLVNSSCEIGNLI